MAENGSAGGFARESFGTLRTGLRLIHAGVLLGARALEAQRLKLSVEGRAPDLQPPCDFRHLPAIVGDGEADRLAFDLLQRAHVAAAIDEAQHVRGLDLLLAPRPWSQGLQRRRADRMRLDLRRYLREFVDADLLAFGKNNGAKDRVLQLAHVAGPAMGGEQRQRLGADAAQVPRSEER